MRTASPRELPALPALLFTAALGGCGGELELRSVPDANGNGDPPAPGGELAPTGGCLAAMPVHEGFEGAFAPSWKVTEPELVALDADEPIAGKQSARFDARPNKFPHVSIPVPAATCRRLALRFTLRVDAGIERPLTIARLRTARASFYLSRNYEAALLITEALTDDEGEVLATAETTSFGSADSNEPTAVTLVFDIDSATVSTSVSTGADAPRTSERELFFFRDGSGADSFPDVIDVAIGSAPGSATGATGSFWIDDLTVE